MSKYVVELLAQNSRGELEDKAVTVTAISGTAAAEWARITFPSAYVVHVENVR